MESLTGGLYVGNENFVKGQVKESFEKAHVKQHTRRSKSGKLTQVRAYEDKRIKKERLNKRRKLQNEINKLKKLENLYEKKSNKFESLIEKYDRKVDKLADTYNSLFEKIQNAPKEDKKYFRKKHKQVDKKITRIEQKIKKFDNLSAKYSGLSSEADDRIDVLREKKEILSVPKHIRKENEKKAAEKSDNREKDWKRSVEEAKEKYMGFSRNELTKILGRKEEYYRRTQYSETKNRRQKDKIQEALLPEMRAIEKLLKYKG